MTYRKELVIRDGELKVLALLRGWAALNSKNDVLYVPIDVIYVLTREIWTKPKTVTDEMLQFERWSLIKRDGKGKSLKGVWIL